MAGVAGASHDEPCTSSSDETVGSIPAVNSATKRSTVHHDRPHQKVSRPRQQNKNAQEDELDTVRRGRKRNGIFQVQLPAPKRHAGDGKQSGAMNMAGSREPVGWQEEENDITVPTNMAFFEGINRSILPEGDHKAEVPFDSVEEQLRQESEAAHEDALGLMNAPSINWLHQQALEMAQSFGEGGEDEATDGDVFPETTSPSRRKQEIAGPDMDAANGETQMQVSADAESQNLTEHQPSQNDGGIGISDQMGRETSTEPSLFVVQSPQTNLTPSKSRGKTRNKAKVPYGEANYYDPSQTSPELGSNAYDARQSRNKELSKEQAGLRLAAVEISVPAHAAAPRGQQRQREGVEGLLPSDHRDQYEVPQEEEEEVAAFPADRSGRLPTTQSSSDNRRRDDDPGQYSVADEDSTCFEAPSESNKLTAVLVDLKGLQSLLNAMGRRGWTNGGKQWHTKLLIGENEDKKRWNRRVRLMTTSRRWQDLPPHAHRLWEKFHNAPRAPKLDKQAAYLGKNEDDIQKAIHWLNRKFDHIITHVVAQRHHAQQSSGENGRSDEDMMCDVYLVIIPLLTLLLQEAAFLGGTDTTDGKARLLPAGRFTSSSMQLILRTTGWIQRLYSAAEEYFSACPEMPVADAAAEAKSIRVATKHRESLAGPLAKFSASLQSATNELDYVAHAPIRRQQAIEKDRLVKLARDMRERELRDAQHRQMWFFVDSMRRMDAPSQLGLNTVEPDTSYFARHGGWHYWEDDKLLGVMRKVTRPNATELRRLLPGRSVAEIRQRITELRDRIRRKYEAEGIVPPQWCYLEPAPNSHDL